MFRLAKIRAYTWFVFDAFIAAALQESTDNS